VSVSGKSNRYVRTSDEGNKARFEFCPDCGATVYYSTESSEAMVAISVGVFAEPLFPAPIASHDEERKHGWVRMPADMERHFQGCADLCHVSGMTSRRLAGCVARRREGWYPYKR